MSEKYVVTVRIGSEEYAIRSPAPSEYTRELAAYIDTAIRGVLAQGPMVQAHKAAILAALAITDELFQARAELAQVRSDVAARGARLAAEVERRLAGSDLAAGG